jgi:antitoxin VapB
MVDLIHLYAYISSMALNLKNAEVERLAAELADLTGESKTETIRRALLERRERLRYRIPRRDRLRDLQRFLASEVWSRVPDDQRGKRLSRDEEADILGPDPGEAS